MPNSLKAFLLVAVFAAVGYAAVYFTFEADDNAVRNGNAPSADIQRPAAQAQVSSGSLAAFVRKPAPEPISDISFQNEADETISLSDFKGRAVLLNLWATWCAPCREEMPALNRLQEEMGGDTFEVVALSLDRKGPAAAKAFLDEVQASALKLYTDKTAKQAAPLRILGMPTTILINPAGEEVGRLAGPADWDSEEAKTLIRSVLPQTAN